jgi:acetoin utilization protein AcuB
LARRKRCARRLFRGSICAPGPEPPTTSLLARFSHWQPLQLSTVSAKKIDPRNQNRRDRVVSNQKRPVRQFMTPGPQCIERQQTLSEAHRLMRLKRARHLPVLASGRLVGILSLGDLHLLEGVAEVDPGRVRVEAAMTPEPYCVSPDTPLDEVVDVMAGNKYGCAVIVEAGQVVGIFTTVDALEAFARVLRGEAPAAVAVNVLQDR